MTEGLSRQVPEPVAAPGDPQTAGPTALAVTDAIPPKCATRTRRYRDGVVVEEGFAPERISDVLAEDDSSVVWLDLHDPDIDDLKVVTEEFGLHPLAVEDAVHDHQRPKLDRYPTHLFANVYAVHVQDGDCPNLNTAEISMFITPRALITVRKSDFDIDALVARWDMDSHLAKDHPVGYLLYGLLDAVVDGQYEAAETLDDCVEELEDALFAPGQSGDIRRRGFEIRRALAALRRVVTPMHELIGRLMRPDMHLSEGGLEPYYRDVFDHVQRTAEAVEAARDMVTSVLDADMTEKSNELNEITKKLASWAAIIAIPTAVTGFYGQNVPYPGFGHAVGFWTSSGIMAVLGIFVYVMLRRRNWL